MELFHKILFEKVAAPLDIIVGIYHPFRDHIWNGLVAGVPFKNSLLSDIVSIIIPWKYLAINLFNQSILPLWNPYSGSGTPLAANFQSSVFYPLNIIFLFFNFLTAWNIYILLIIILSGFFCYLFLRQKKVGKIGALFGSSTFAFSGFMVVWLEYGVVGHAFLWLPLMLFSADKLINSSTLKFLPLLSASVAMSFLAGYPQMTAYTLLTLLLFIIFAVFIDIKSVFKRIWTILFLGIFIIIGAALSSFQLIPGLELLANSLRGSDPVVSSLNYGFLPVQNFITLFAPDFFGNPATGNFFGKISYNDLAFYVGIIPLSLAILAPVFQRNKGVRFFIFLSVLSIILSTENPVSKMIYAFNIPGLSGGIASRALSLFDFSVCMLSGYGLDNLIKNRGSKKLFRSFLLISLLILLILIAIWFFSFSQNLEISKRNLILPSLVFFLSTFLLFVYIKLKNTKFLIIAVMFLVLFELTRQCLKYNPITDRNYFYPQTKVTEFLTENVGIYRISGTIPTNMTTPYGFYSPESYDAMLLKRYSEFLGIVNNSKPIAGSRYGEISNYKSNLINLMGIKYILTIPEDYKTNFKPDEKDFPNNQFQKVFSYGKTSVYENLDVLPRAFLVGDKIIEPDPQKIATLLLSEDFDFKKTAILEKDINLQKNNCEGKVEIKNYQANKIDIFINSPSECLLFLSDNYYPGWKAYIDGKETEILRANYAFRAIAVPTGEHAVNFEYQPKSFKIGLYITVLSAALLFLLYEYISHHPKL